MTVPSMPPARPRPRGRCRRAGVPSSAERPGVGVVGAQEAAGARRRPPGARRSAGKLCGPGLSHDHGSHPNTRRPGEARGRVIAPAGVIAHRAGGGGPRLAGAPRAAPTSPATSGAAAASVAPSTSHRLATWENSSRDGRLVNVPVRGVAEIVGHIGSVGHIGHVGHLPQQGLRPGPRLGLAVFAHVTGHRRWPRPACRDRPGPSAEMAASQSTCSSAQSAPITQRHLIRSRRHHARQPSASARRSCRVVRAGCPRSAARLPRPATPPPRPGSARGPGHCCWASACSALPRRRR
jgi:hypothetical protein